MLRLLRVCFNRMLRYLSTPKNQRRSITIALLFFCLTLLTTSYFAGQQRTYYSTFYRLKLNELNYHWNLKSIRLCCLVSTSPEHLLTRAQAVYSTWGQRCDKLFFLTEYSEKNLTIEQKTFLKQISIISMNEIEAGYTHLTQKSIRALIYVYQYYFDDFDWFIKADDDTYIIIENLKEFLHDKDTWEPITYGYNFQVLVPDGYQSGGASYVLSREALKRFYQAKLIPNNTDCEEDEGLEDVEIARCLRGQGVQLGKSLDEQKRELFHPLKFHEHFRGDFPKWLKFYASNRLQSHYNCCSERTISFHYMPPEDIYYMEFLLYKLRLK